MTLRRRLVVAVAGLAAALVVAGVGVVLVQRAFLVDRLDAQLATLAQSPRAILIASARADAGAPSAGLSEVWVGRMSADGRLTTVLAPASDPALLPALSPGEAIPTPQGRATASGESRRVRVVTASMPNGRAQAVIAIPTTSADVAVRRLALTLGLVGLVVAGVVALLLWWVYRLGLRPIAAMTVAADAIRAGDTTRRVPTGPPGTEAARLGEALNAMIDATTATQERMRRFVADASHELRTPLTTLQGYAALHTGRTGTPVVGGPDRTTDAAGHDGPDAGAGAGAGGDSGAGIHDGSDAEVGAGAGGDLGAGIHDGSDAEVGAGAGGDSGAGVRTDDGPGRPDGAGEAAAMRDAMRRMGEEAARMRRLVDGLLDLAVLDDLGVLATERVDLGVLVRDVASDLRVVAPDRVVTVDAPESLVVTGDRDRLTQALVGLTSNAVRHTPAGTPVWLRLARGAGAVRIDVADAGPGIPPDHVGHVVERFHRVDPGRSSARGGTGLGLAIVDAIARAHGGSLAVASELGRGSTFTVTLPTVPGT